MKRLPSTILVKRCLIVWSVECAVFGRCFMHRYCGCESKWMNRCQAGWDISTISQHGRTLPFDASKVAQKCSLTDKTERLQSWCTIYFTYFIDETTLPFIFNLHIQCMSIYIFIFLIYVQTFDLRKKQYWFAWWGCNTWFVFLSQRYLNDTFKNSFESHFHNQLQADSIWWKKAEIKLKSVLFG